MNEQSFIMMKYIYPVWVVKVKEKMRIVQTLHVLFVEGLKKNGNAPSNLIEIQYGPSLFVCGFLVPASQALIQIIINGIIKGIYLFPIVHGKACQG